ncbi:MAG: transcriptional repressor [Bacteroidaceae bacterium]|nr:transcriptional repressor [Bacteroidaceae bacterium]
MRAEDYAHHLESCGVRPTATRLLVFRAMAESRHAMSLRELDERLDSVDRSTIFRTLALLADAHLLHVIEDGSGVALYEVCDNPGDCHPDDQHIHFYCRRCQRTYCLRSIHVPTPALPDGFRTEGVNFLVKGLCPLCSEQP